MKKKNIFKKLMSVILSAATMFSLLTLPAHAIIPGEDAYTGQEDGYVYVDFENKTTEFVPKTFIPKFTGTSTYDVLSLEDRSRMQNISEQYICDYGQGVSAMDVDDGAYSFVNPEYGGIYSGVVAIAVFVDNVYQGYSTGFMLNNNTFMTTLHTIYDSEVIDGNKEFIIPEALPEIRVYFGVNTTLSYDPTVPYAHAIACETYFRNNPNYVVASRGVFSSAIENTGTDYTYDWFLGKLETTAPGNTYYFNCMVPDSSLINKRSFIIGYPAEYTFQMVETTGTIIEIWDFIRNIKTSNCISSGMSGGPVYVAMNGLKCFGIHRADGSWETMIYDDLMDVIIDFMNE